MIEETVRAPDARLARIIGELCGVAYTASVTPSLIPPHWTVSIVARASRGATPTLWVQGPSPRIRPFVRGELAWAAGVELRVASAREMLGVPLAALGALSVPLDDVWPRARVARLADGLAAASTMSARLAALHAALEAHATEARVVAASASAATIAAAVAALDRDDASVASVASGLGLSTRQMLRLFRDRVGVSPKECAALLRLTRALALLDTQDLAQVAVTAGYYDQAHMNLEFRSRLGMSPGAWRARAAA
ncbi:MAG: AraC family transcriptional regulator [Kofleriaceae bacterium]|nr:AraC family transcriptional regulator [Kofleriaceae bacterium]